MTSVYKRMVGLQLEALVNIVVIRYILVVYGFNSVVFLITLYTYTMNVAGCFKCILQHKCYNCGT